ncbi:MAG: DUF5989 family protein [Planctomycetota bacterium]|jgi:hypothetical protein
MAKRRGIIGEFVLFLKEHKSYWLLPILVILLIFTMLLILSTVGGGVLSPFLYTFH